MSTDWKSIRAQFPALENWIFLNTATYGQTPQAASSAVVKHLAHRDELACSDFLSWFDDADRIRGRVAELVRCEPDDVAFIGNAATGLSLLIGGIDWRPGDRIVTLPDEFPNNLYYPALLAGRGVEFIEAPWQSFLDTIAAGARLVVVSTVNYTNGFRPPLDQVIEAARAAGALTCIDGTQSVGALTFDYDRLQPDMLVVDAYKWMLSPNGAGFMTVSKTVRVWLKPNVVGGTWTNCITAHRSSRPQPRNMKAAC
jgi:selenocysteine lyase/cysteine desulfurase